MLDMGFSDDILQIEKMLPRERQTILFSATMPAKIQQLARTILKDPVEIKIAVSKPAEKIKQEVVFCCEVEKLKAVKWLFTHYPTQRVIIFASSKIKVKDIARALLRKGFNVGEMHSDLDQKERDAVMYSFKTQQIDILVATDIVARGIDIDDIQLVVNYDLPHDAEDYVHRIGRTARANNDGNALTLVSEKEYTAFKRMERQLEIEIPAVTLPEDFVKPELKEESFKKKGRRPKKKGKGGQGEGKPKSESRKSDTPKSQKAQKPQEGKTAAENATDNTGNEVKADQAEKKPAKKRRNRHRRKKSDKPTEGGEQKPATPTE